MTVVFSVAFDCETCHAHMVFEDEIPQIHRDRTRIVDLNKARTWVDKYYKSPYKVQAAMKLGDIPRMVSLNAILEMAFPNGGPVVVELPIRYINCVVCGDRIYFD